MTDQQFDVFLAHNSKDKPLVREIYNELKKQGINPWLDEEEIPPGHMFQELIQQAIRKVRASAICIGKEELGKWQRMELLSITSRCVDSGVKVIPVLLPGVEELPGSLLFLKEFQHIKFSSDIYDERAYYLLKWGITGKKPSPVPVVVPTYDQYIDILSQQDSTSDFIEQWKNSEQKKDHTESEIQKIDERIDHLKSILIKDKAESLVSVLDWLNESQEVLATSAGNYVIRRYIHNKDSLNDFNDRVLYWTLEKVIEIVSHCLLTDENDVMYFVERLSVSEPFTCYVVAGIDHMRIDIHEKRFSEPIRAKTSFFLDEILKCILFSGIE